MLIHKEAPVHELKPLQSEDTQLVLTHISIQRKIIVYDPLVITCPCPLMLGSESLHEGGKGSYSVGVSPTGRKRSPDSESANSSNVLCVMCMCACPGCLEE